MRTTTGLHSIGPFSVGFFMFVTINKKKIKKEKSEKNTEIWFV